MQSREPRVYQFIQERQLLTALRDEGLQIGNRQNPRVGDSSAGTSPDSLEIDSIMEMTGEGAISVPQDLAGALAPHVQSDFPRSADATENGGHDLFEPSPWGTQPAEQSQ